MKAEDLDYTSTLRRYAATLKLSRASVHLASSLLSTGDFSGAKSIDEASKWLKIHQMSNKLLQFLHWPSRGLGVGWISPPQWTHLAYLGLEASTVAVESSLGSLWVHILMMMRIWKCLSRR